MPTILETRLAKMSPHLPPPALLLCTSFLLCAIHACSPGFAFAAAPEHAAQNRKHKPTPRPAPLATAIQSFLANPAVARDHWGISVITLDGRSLYALDDDRYFIPASNTKLFTTAAAMALLPEPSPVADAPDPMLHCGDAQGNVSTLSLVGTGDPTFASRAFPYHPQPMQGTVPAHQAEPPLAALENLADRVKAHGVRSVQSVIGDDRLYPFERYGTGWAWDDLQWSDGVPVTALALNDNMITLDLRPGADAGTPVIASWTPQVDYYALENQAITASAGDVQPKSQLGVERAPGSKTVRLFGSMPLDSKGAHLKLALEDPAEFAAIAFRRMLIDRGIPVAGGASALHRPSASTTPFEDGVQAPALQATTPQATSSNALTPHSVQTDPLDAPPGSCAVPLAASGPWIHQDVVVINKLSQNLHAELLLRRLGRVRGFEGSFVQGARIVRRFAISAGIDPDDFFFYDGSGMSAADIVTPRAITRLLAYAAGQPWGEEWRTTLPIAGVDGTLANRFSRSPLKGTLFAKTGTLSEVNALSGYLLAASGRTIVFSILVDSHRPGSSLNPDQARTAMDKILEAIAAAN